MNTKIDPKTGEVIIEFDSMTQVVAKMSRPLLKGSLYSDSLRMYRLTILNAVCTLHGCHCVMQY